MPSSNELIAALDHGADESDPENERPQEPASELGPNIEHTADADDGGSLRAAAAANQPEDVSEKPLQDGPGDQSSKTKETTLDPPQQQEQPAKPDRLVLEKYAMYKTESRLYVIASNQSDSRYRVLKIDRHYSANDPTHDLNITEDGMIYSKQEVSDLLKMIEDGNKTTGGLQKVVPLFYGIVGFIRFTAGWYAVLIKQRAAVALIGGHYVYHCEESLMISVSANVKPDKPVEESRLYSAFQQVDLSKNFYFSYTYDLTGTLQANLTQPTGNRPASSIESSRVQHVADHAFHEVPAGSTPNVDRATITKSAWGFNDRFVWNHFLLSNAFFESMETEGRDGKKERSCWVLPLVYGYVDQAKVSVFGRTIYITLIARRSRYFAGARFLKRGVNDEGNVANDVESEQIVSEALTTSFYVPASGKSGEEETRQLNPRYTSYVQNRGSIPLSWQQDTSTASLKPPIHLHLIDPYHSAAALHFDDLFYRYGAPIIALNLIKRKEHEARESRLIEPFKECIDYLNQFLPEEQRVRYIPFDMSAAYKNRTMDVIGVLEDIAEEVIETTGFFHSGAEPAVLEMLAREKRAGGEETASYRSTPLLQEGVCRTNCIDCLDRTNAAQFVIAKAAFGHQLHALGVLSDPHLGYDNDAVNLLTEMYHDHGDTIALQYGGSHLVNTMNTYRKINQWTSHSRDMIEGIKRFYANVALDQDKQNSINLFLGIEGADSNLLATQPISSTLSGGSALSRKPTPALDSLVVDSSGGIKYAEGSPNTQTHLELEKSSEHALLEDGPKQESQILRARRDYRHWFTRQFLDRQIQPEELHDRANEGSKHDGNYWLEYYRPKLFTQLERHFAYKVNSTTRYNPRMNGSDRYVTDASELSPFKERPIMPMHAARIGVGVKRWMTVNKKASRESDTLKGPKTGKSKNINDGQKGDGDLSDEEASLPPPNTTEGLATRLLKPKVRPAEAAEYTSYVNQFKNLNLSNELAYESSAGDLAMYEQAVRLARGENATVDKSSEEIYEKHCRFRREQFYSGTQSTLTTPFSVFSEGEIRGNESD